MIVCPCGYRREVKVWPLYCRCGRVHRETADKPPRREAFAPCDHRGAEELERLPCGGCGAGEGLPVFECHKYGCRCIPRRHVAPGRRPTPHTDKRICIVCIADGEAD